MEKHYQPDTDINALAQAIRDLRAGIPLERLDLAPHIREAVRAGRTWLLTNSFWL